MKRIIFASILSAVTLHCGAQDFDTFFCDSTIRIDYDFSGTSTQQHIAVDAVYKSNHWYGRRQRLSELPVEGNGQLTVRDHRSQQVIYSQSFSTLFQEWQSYPISKSSTRSFENVFLMPMPKDTVDVTLELRNNRREVSATLTHQLAPRDILIRRIGDGNQTPFVVMQQPDNPRHCIHIAYLAEGYRKEEMSKFLADVRKAMGALFAHEPFKSLQGKFSIVAVESPSSDSGTSEPSKGIWKQTALGSHFDTFYSERYLTTPNIRRMHDWLAGIPYEHIIALVNTDRYGGGGIYGEYLLATIDNKYSEEVVVHEFGHSFCGLADEYAYDDEEVAMYPKDVEPWERNITTCVDFHGKWEHIPGAGFFEGAGYTLHGVYRAYPDCRMRSNKIPSFCKACQKAITDYIRFFTE